MSDKMEKMDPKNPETVADRAWVAPRVDIFENQDELLLMADIPGVSKDKIKINLDKEQLIIEGLVQAHGSETVLGREFQELDFRRSFIVPAGIDAEHIAADLKKGVLSLHLPKSAALKPRHIEVKAG